MNIVYTISDVFVPQASACITSVYENNKNVKNLNVFIVAINMSQKHQKIIKNIGKKYNRKCYIIELNDIKSQFDFKIDTHGWHISVLARFFFDKLLPKWVEKVIYLDGDTICLRNLEELWNIDMSENVIAGSIEPTKRDRAIKELGLTADDPCINAGVLLINLKKWREEKTGERIIKYYKEHNGILSTNDQDAINGSLKQEIKVIKPKFNYYTSYIYYPYKYLKKFQEPYKFIPESWYEEASREPVIIHYLGEERPWRKGCKHPYQKEFDYYMSLTPFKDKEKDKGWELYFFFFYIFNFFAKLFPGLRVLVIDTFAPFLMKKRQKKIVKDEGVCCG